MAHRRLVVLSGIFLLCGVVPSAKGQLVINLDYSHDTFFAAHPTAQAALEAAASDLASQITTNLGTVATSYSGTSGGLTLTFSDWEYFYTNPTTGASESVATNTVSANEVTIFVGVRNLGGSTLGQGGPGFANFGTFSFSGSGDVAAATADLEANATAGLSRGGGPVISQLSGNVSGNAYAIDIGSGVGHLWFDVDTDNDGFTDSDLVLDSFWHFDHTSSVPFAEFDFYSVAVHELAHAIGFGTSDSWDDFVDTTNVDFEGPNSTAQFGGDVPLDSGLGHWQDGLLSGILAMDPSITNGDRKPFTTLDYAGLADIGWTVSTVPEPSTYAMMSLAIVGLGFYVRRNRQAA